MRQTVTTYYLEMTSPEELRPSRAEGAELLLMQAEIPCPQLNRFLYTAVGSDWLWIDRLPWTDAEWLAYLNRPELETWVGYVAGTPAGYFELEKQPGDNVEIAYEVDEDDPEGFIATSVKVVREWPDDIAWLRAVEVLEFQGKVRAEIDGQTAIYARDFPIVVRDRQVT